MFKFNFDLDIDAQAMHDELERGVNKAVKRTATPLQQYLKEEAGRKLENSLSLWKEGLKLESLGEDSYMIILSGKLALMVEDGFSGEQLKEMLLSGPRATHNATESKSNKRWVDVPFGISSESIKRGDIAGINISQFRDANAVMSNFTRTTKAGQVGPASAKTREVKVQNKVGQTIQKVLYSQSSNPSVKVGFMTIRRVGEESELKGWKGAKIFDQNSKIEEFISKQFNVEFHKIEVF